MRTRRNRAFTLIELMVVIVMISILTTMAIVGYSSIQKDTRDSARSSKSTVIAEALERYYDKNNEYPSVASLAGQSIATIKTKLSIKDDDVLVFPKWAVGTSAIVSSSPSTTRLAYTAATVDYSANTQCQTDVNGYCDSYLLQYVEESGGATVAVNSRQSPDVAAASLTAPTKPSVVGAQSGSNIIFTASASTCSLGAVEYKIRYSTVSAGSLPDWSTVSWSAATTKTIAAGANTTFYSSALAQCVSGANAGPSSAESNVHTLTLPSAPSPVVASASALSSSSIQVSWSTSTGTAPITYSVAGSGTASSCTVSPCNVTGLSAGTFYTFTVTATNSVGSTSGSASATTSPVGCSAAPSQPAVSASATTATSIQVSWSASSTPSGCSAPTYTVTGAGTASSCSSSPCTVTGLASSTNYTFTVTASNGYGSAGGSASATTSAAACAAPSGLTGNGSAASSTSVQLSWSVTSSCSVTFSVSGSGNASSCTTSGCTVSSLSASASYTFTLTAANSGGSASTTITVSTSPPTLSAGATEPDEFGMSTISWAYSPSSYTPASTVKFNVGSYCTNLGSTVRSCTIDSDPCKIAKTLMVSDTNGVSTTANIPARPAYVATKPDISNVGDSTVSGSTIVVRWNWTGDTSFVQIQLNGPSGQQLNINDDRAGNYQTGNLQSGAWTVKVAAANCRYRASWSFSGGNYDTANVSSVFNRNIP